MTKEEWLGEVKNQFKERLGVSESDAQSMADLASDNWGDEWNDASPNEVVDEDLSYWSE